VVFCHYIKLLQIDWNVHIYFFTRCVFINKYKQTYRVKQMKCVIRGGIFYKGDQSYN